MPTSLISHASHQIDHVIDRHWIQIGPFLCNSAQETLLLPILSLYIWCLMTLLSCSVINTCLWSNDGLQSAVTWGAMHLTSILGGCMLIGLNGQTFNSRGRPQGALCPLSCSVSLSHATKKVCSEEAAWVVLQGVWPHFVQIKWKILPSEWASSTSLSFSPKEKKVRTLRNVRCVSENNICCCNRKQVSLHNSSARVLDISQDSADEGSHIGFFALLFCSKQKQKQHSAFVIRKMRVNTCTLWGTHTL